MTTLRDHAVYTVTFSHLTKNRIEDSLGELRGYSSPYRIQVTVTLVSPSELIATAWVMNRWSRDEPLIETVESTKLDAFIQDHVW